MSDQYIAPSGAALAEARQRGNAGAVVETALEVLLGEPLQYLYRAADMIVVGFGDEVLPLPMTVHDDMDADRRARIEKRNAEPLARYRLHIQCPFRLDSPTGPFLGGQDIYRHAEPPHDWIEGHDFKGCFFDQRARDGSELDGPPLMVEAVSADRGGGFVVELSEGWSITVAPSSAILREFWRFFDAAGGDHFVVFAEPEGAAQGAR